MSMPIAVVDDLQLVDESDVDRAEDVLGDLHRLRRRGRGHRHDLVHEGAVEGDGQRRGWRRRRPPTTFGIEAVA